MGSHFEGNFKILLLLYQYLKGAYEHQMNDDKQSEVVEKILDSVSKVSVLLGTI